MQKQEWGSFIVLVCMCISIRTTFVKYIYYNYMHTVIFGGMVLFWATIHTPVHAAMLEQSRESSKTSPPRGTEENHYENT